MKQICNILLFFLISARSYTRNFTDHFQNRTLRVDYIFTGNSKQQMIYPDKLSQFPSWADYEHRLSELPLEGSGQITARDLVIRQCIYKTFFSSLLQEWLSTDEAEKTAKGFENIFLFPYPKQSAEVEIMLFSPRKGVMISFKHVVRPGDILIHRRGTSRATPRRYILQSDNEKECIDIATPAEDYTEKETDLLYQDTQKVYESLFSHEPFRSMKDKFNIVAVASPLIDSGVNVPRENQWKHTVVYSHFSTFYSDRYLTISRMKATRSILASIPYEHIIIPVSTDVYGGGGTYNSYTLTTAHRPMSKPVAVYEFGHSFGGLTGEYFCGDDMTMDTYPLDVEPWGQNISTRVNFALKWGSMFAPSTSVPAPVAQHQNYPIGVYEGGGHSAKNICRLISNCRMKMSEYSESCPVCQRAIQRTIEFYAP